MTPVRVSNGCGNPDCSYREAINIQLELDRKEPCQKHGDLVNPAKESGQAGPSGQAESSRKAEARAAPRFKLPTRHKSRGHHYEESDDDREQQKKHKREGDDKDKGMKKTEGKGKEKERKEISPDAEIVGAESTWGRIKRKTSTSRRHHHHHHHHSKSGRHDPGVYEDENDGNREQQKHHEREGHDKDTGKQKTEGKGKEKERREMPPGVDVEGAESTWNLIKRKTSTSRRHHRHSKSGRHDFGAYKDESDGDREQQKHHKTSSFQHHRRHSESSRHDFGVHEDDRHRDKDHKKKKRDPSDDDGGEGDRPFSCQPS
jgi:hypothetical protein